MAYQKTVWEDQDVENPRTYVMRDNGDDTVTLLDAFGIVTKLGTPVNAANMNHIENGIAAIEARIDNILNRIWKVGSLYLDTENSETCPMADLIPNSTWELVAQNKALWGGDGTNANTSIDAGLPNILGTWAANCMTTTNSSISTTGALYNTKASKVASDSYSASASGGIGLDASLSNAIYGNSDTVQPPAYRVNIWRRTA